MISTSIGFAVAVLIQSVSYVPIEFLVYHIVGHALLRLNIQFQIGNWRAFFRLSEVGLTASTSVSIAA